MRIPEDALFEYQKIVLEMDSLFHGKSTDLVIPAVMSFLGAAGAFSGVEKKEFISWVVERIDDAYEEYKRRKE